MDISLVDRKLVEKIIHFSVIKLGYSQFCPKFPRVILYKDRYYARGKRCKGYYDSQMNTLVIFKKAHSKFSDFIDTIIHEYVHYLQDHQEYEVLGKTFEYKDHPHEVEARNIAKKLTPKAKRWLKKINS